MVSRRKYNATSATWDPVLLISQIVTIQAIHYLVISLIVPGLLHLYANRELLLYEGGAMNVGMVMDWREMASRPTVRGLVGEDRWSSYSWAWSGGKKIGYGVHGGAWDGQTDPRRGWIIAFGWMCASLFDIFALYHLVRRPRLILDFALTLVFNHLVLTTYYSASIPTSFFFWMVMLAGALVTVIVTEQMCVAREMKEGLSVTSIREDEATSDEMEMGLLSHRD